MKAKLFLLATVLLLGPIACSKKADSVTPPAPVQAGAGDVSVSVPTEGAQDAMKAAGAATDATVTLQADPSADTMSASTTSPASPAKK